MSHPTSPPPEFVLIEWYDSHYQAAWTRGSPETMPLKCWSLGWIMHNGPHAVTIAAHLAYDDECDSQRCGEMTIPKVAIVSIKNIAIYKEAKP